MVPAVSWPKTRGGGTVPYWIFLMSVGQTPQAATWTSSSSGPDARHGHGFEPQIIGAAVDHRLHVLGIENMQPVSQRGHGFYSIKRDDLWLCARR